MEEWIDSERDYVARLREPKAQQFAGYRSLLLRVEPRF
jgi:hypothetical protein